MKRTISPQEAARDATVYVRSENIPEVAGAQEGDKSGLNPLWQTTDVTLGGITLARYNSTGAIDVSRDGYPLEAREALQAIYELFQSIVAARANVMEPVKSTEKAEKK